VESLKADVLIMETGLNYTSNINYYLC